MKNYISMILVLSALLLTGCSKPTLVNGEVFIVTKGSGSVKLALTTVSFIPMETFAKAISNRDSLQIFHASFKTLDSVAVTKKKNAALDSAKIILGRMNATKKEIRDNEYPSTQSLSKRILELETSIYQSYMAMADSFNFRTEEQIVALAKVVIAIRYCQSHPSEFTEAKTNADGKFSVELPSNEYYVFAENSRMVREGNERYIWYFKYIPDGKKPLFLSNDNLSTMFEGLM